MMSTNHFLQVALCLSVTGGVYAEQLSGVVRRISDGDTINLMDERQQTVTVRLAGIDAPEKAQDFGWQAKRELTELCLNQSVEAVVRTTDRYGRTVARVRCANIDVAGRLLQQGLAWHYTRFAKSQPADEAEADRQAQELAKRAEIGVWSMPTPIAPWDWRARQRVPVSE
jgi:endonuclease YncB( thermonuclease family)